MKPLAVLFSVAVLNSTAVADFASWRTANFPADLTHLEISGELADPDEDGFSNLLEYVFDTNPQVSDPSTIVGSGFNANRPTVTVRIRKPLFDAKLQIMGSSDLRTWSAVNALVEVSRVPGTTYDTVTFAHPTVTRPPAAQYFLRPRAVLFPSADLGPDSLTLAGESGGVFRLRWQDNSTTESLFNVRRRVDGGAWGIITTAAADATTALDSAPPPSGLVEYYVSNSYGLSNIVAMRPGDGDADGIPDSVELAAGLDPFDWRDGMADTDGDRIPNLWEHQAGTSITSAASKPAPTFIVDPANAANSPTDNIVATIQGAINATPTNSTTPPYSIIEVKAGTYAENISISSDRRIALYGVGLPEILPPANFSAALIVNGESAVDGFRIRRGELISSSRAMTVSLPLAASHARVSNLVVHGHREDTGTAFGIFKGRVAIAHCTAFGNGTGVGSSLYVSYNTSQVEVLNSIFWNEGGVATELSLSEGFARASQSIFYGSGPAGALVRTPFLNAYGFLTAPSLARNLGLIGMKTDAQGESRDATPDVGADEFRDADGDGLPDWVEALGATNANDDLDGDGAANLYEYQTLGTPLNVADTDGDGLVDGAELAVGGNPFDSDTDNDGMLDGYEALRGLAVNDSADALEDLDGDRVPNLYEAKNGTDAANAASKPTPHFFVNAATGGNSSSDNIYVTIQQAVNAANSAAFTHPMIEVAPGSYGSFSTGLKPMLVLAVQGDFPATIGASASSAYAGITVGTANTVVDGFTLTRSDPAVTQIGLYVSLSAGDRVRLVNCIIRDCGAVGLDDGGAIDHRGGELTLVHCTLYGNEAGRRGRAAYLLGTSKLILKNSIVWNRTGAAPEQISGDPGITIVTQNSFILGGEYGAFSNDPQIDRYGGLYASSPALNGALVLPIAKTDFHGDLRATLPDIGADERVDSDADGLPDWWERTRFGNLAATAAGDADGDGLSNYYEYIFGTNPSVADSDGDGLGDLADVLANLDDPFFPAEFLADDDNDALTLGFELLYGTNPQLADTNGDGVVDGVSIQAGISATGADADGDGLTFAQEIAADTSPFLADTDGDGVNDGADAFPRDPSRTTAPAGSAGDVTAPLIFLDAPEGATPI